MGDASTSNKPGEVRVADVEAALGRIPSVSAARVVTGPGGRVTEVHVLAGRDRAPKQLVRDVQSVALTGFGLEVDYRTVSVVQLDDPSPSPARIAPLPSADGHPGLHRPELVRVATDVTANTAAVRVDVRVGSRELTGRARGPAASVPLLVARAVIDAVSPLIGSTVIELDRVDVVDSGPSSVALCVVQTVSPARDLTVAGAAVVRSGAPDALARATMDALNRLIRGEGDEHGAHPGPTADAEPATKT